MIRKLQSRPETCATASLWRRHRMDVGEWSLEARDWRFRKATSCNFHLHWSWLPLLLVPVFTDGIYCSCTLQPGHVMLHPLRWFKIACPCSMLPPRLLFTWGVLPPNPKTCVNLSVAPTLVFGMLAAGLELGEVLKVHCIGATPDLAVLIGRGLGSCWRPQALSIQSWATNKALPYSKEYVHGQWMFLGETAFIFWVHSVNHLPTFTNQCNWIFTSLW